MDDITKTTEECTSTKRQIKMTEKAKEEKLLRFVQSRKAKLAQLTRKSKEIEQLMDDAAHVDTVRTKLETEYKDLYKDFCQLNHTIEEFMSEEDYAKDQHTWFEPRSCSCERFITVVQKWMKQVAENAEQAVQCDLEINPDDSISSVSVTSSKKHKKHGSVDGRSTASTTSSARISAEAERAALLVKHAALKKEQAIERQEAELKAKREEFELEVALAASDAKIKVIKQYESCRSSAVSHKEVDLESGSITPHEDVFQPLRPQSTNNTVPNESYSGREGNVVDTLCNAVERQANIAECLVKHQKWSMLPSIDIPIFKGDPLDYKLFIRAFEHGVEDRTDNDKDRLYFMEQYTTGKPKELVRSCLHMNPAEGYLKAKQLLREHFGNEYQIAVAYMNKALQWPSIRPEDGEALHSFSLFLSGCCNAMSDISYMEVMDNAANLRAIAVKLPYKLREKWRSVACGIQEKQNARVKFKDLVDFINKQARISLHPVFGDIKETSK